MKPGETQGSKNLLIGVTGSRARPVPTQVRVVVRPAIPQASVPFQEVSRVPTTPIHRPLRIAAGTGLAALVALVALRFGAGVLIVAKAAGIPSNAQGIGGFVNGAKALVDPALVMVAAIAPLALIAGGLVLLFGGRRGMQIIGTSLGVLLLLGSVTALIN